MSKLISSLNGGQNKVEGFGEKVERGRFCFFNSYLRIRVLILKREDGGGRERHGSAASHMCPDWGSNLPPLGTQDDAPAQPPGQGPSFH